MEDKRCPVFVDGKDCGLPADPSRSRSRKIARYDLATYQCGLGHRSYFLLEPRSKAKPSDRAREEIERKIDELTRKYVETREPEIREAIYELAKQLEEMEKSDC